MTVSPTVTCPSPPMATLPLRRTARMVVARMRGRGLDIPENSLGRQRPRHASGRSKKQGTRKSRPLLFHFAEPRLRVLIHATRELRVRLVTIRHREEHARTVVAVLEERAARINRVLRALILAHETAQIAETLTAAERPERLLTEEQRGGVVLGRRRGERSQRARRL